MLTEKIRMSLKPFESPFLKKIPEVISLPEPKGRVLYFTGCATCSTALKKEYPHLLQEMGEKTEEAMALSQR
jgi:Fe-S oxidoreductase